MKLEAAELKFIITSPIRNKFTLGKMNAEHTSMSLVDPENIIWTPLYIKLNLIKNFIKAMTILNIYTQFRQEIERGNV